jgi:hypothetical protein
MAAETLAIGDPGELYPRLVDGWASLPPAIRALHTIGRASGTFDVRIGANIFARMLAWFCGFPPAREATPVLLRVTRDGRFQRWHRTIGTARMVSRQWDAESRLCEGFGLFECHFDVEGRDGCLLFSQRTACVALGTFRIRIPAALAPSIRAEVCSDGDGARVSVAMSMPILGPILSYTGLVYAEPRS